MPVTPRLEFRLDFGIDQCVELDAFRRVFCSFCLQGASREVKGLDGLEIVMGIEIPLDLKGVTATGRQRESDG